ncbi:MAG TPA: hypothetical protein VIL72_00795 [Beijerinckiaceae bacterium]
MCDPPNFAAERPTGGYRHAKEAHCIGCSRARAILKAPAPAALAQDGADYAGKTVRLLIGFSAGGEYDLQARLIARHIGRNLPGRPNVVPENMVGAGGLTMANYLAAIAPKDGTALGMLTNTLHLQQAAGLPGVKFDAGEFGWVGALSPTVETLALWKTARAKDIREAREAREQRAGDWRMGLRLGARRLARRGRRRRVRGLNSSPPSRPHRPLRRESDAAKFPELLL